MKIYFCGAIAGGREDKEIYSKLIEYLERYGEVLTKNVGIDSLIDEDRKLNDEVIFQRDVSWLVDKADVVVGELSVPSHGVGYEAGLVERYNKPHLFLFRRQNERRLSSMISGNRNLMVMGYDNFEDALFFIDEFMNDFLGLGDLE